MPYDIMPSARLSYIESRVSEVFSMAEICHWSHSELLDQIKIRIHDPINYRTPGGKRRHSVWVAGYASGLVAARISDIWRSKVEFCYVVNGEIFSTCKKSARKTTAQFYDAGQSNILADCEGRHYWIGTDKAFS